MWKKIVRSNAQNEEIGTETAFFRLLCFKTNVICRTALLCTFGVPGQFRHELRGSQGVYHGRGQVHRRGHRTLFTQRNARGRARTRSHALHLEVS